MNPHTVAERLIAARQTAAGLLNWDRIAGKWKQMKGSLRERWGKLTEDELDQLAGKRDKLVGKIQEQYGISKDEAERQVGEFADRQRDYEKI